MSRSADLHPTLLMIAGAMTYVRKGIAPHELADLLHRSIRARPLCQAPALA